MARPQAPLTAVVLMITATLFIAGTMLAAKSLGTDTLGAPLHPLQISHGRFMFAFIGFITASAVLRPKIRAPNMRLHMARTIFGATGVTLMFAAVAFIPMSDATAISFLNPVFGMILAIPFLGEKVGRWRWLAAAMAFVGALILLRPGPDTFQVAALLALGAALAMGFELVLIKKLADREPALQILLINNAIGCVLMSVAVIAFWAPPTLAQWGVLVTLGLMMAGAQTCFINAIARADASFVTPFSYLTLIFAGLYDWAIFAQIPDWISVLGAAIIVSGAALLAWREAVNRSRARRIPVSMGGRV
ncbi:putative S-adenosylmethionine uptake transporter [Octadecabacter arcticus 238]|jgi:drug/metabolite transporter (DMT)-like permease|uniref:Putative S-adenosylmethionine uptake transporter n=1 Tax=Octadecabacter arcticus 238 TaxID=391616 RepID=M9RL68_9RHOB|nr:DMT family transporter [Octadecabacter arcticus]AGI73324.1 putative S-adenosylmethionine uptake transporter [Octadecabacter arcticus 238]